MFVDETPTYPGIGRLGYFWWNTVVGVWMFVAALKEVPPAAALILGAIVLALASASRLSNLGMNPAWAWLSFVPIANWILWARCQIFPAGYAQTKRIDDIAKVLIGLVFAVFVVVFVLLIAAVILGA